jgi:hypothetical protein
LTAYLVVAGDVPCECRHPWERSVAEVPREAGACSALDAGAD